MLRPSDEPTSAHLEFNWFDIHAEALARTIELRRQKWLIKQRELQLIQARNQLLPQLDLVGTYRWVGRGDTLGLGSRNGANFGDPGATALDVLTEGDFQEYSLGFLFRPPAFGARAELNGIRNSELNLQRERARLEDMELNVSHLLSRSLREMDSQYALSESHFNRLKASASEVRSAVALYEGGKTTLDLLLDAQRRRSDAELAYYQSLVGYMKQIAHVHYRKGSYLEYNNIQLAEGPWPDKAYWDALGHARRRDASYYLDYGTTRPSVVSRGPSIQDQSGIHHGTVMPENLSYPHENVGPGQSVLQGGNATEQAEMLPAPQPAPARKPMLELPSEPAAPQIPNETAPNLLQPGTTKATSPGPRRVSSLTPLRGNNSSAGRPMVQHASHQEPITTASHERSSNPTSSQTTGGTTLR